jgi:DNA (cytosine-5)-methyltransferase 1
MKIGSLCTGYGGLDMAVEEFFNAEVVWTADTDKYASQIIQQRIGKINLGDIKQIDWSSIEPIDILTAGYPCQPFSHAGQRKGVEDERHIWPFIEQAIGNLRPSIIVLENVRGHLSLGLKEVLACLTNLGYDARWEIVRASDVGAPHRRARIFIVAYANSHAREKSRRTFRGIYGEAAEIFNWSNRSIDGRSDSDAGDADDEHKSHDRQVQELGRRFTPRRQMHMQTAPNALDEDGKLSSLFVEYMMGLPKGWVTDSGLSRAQQLKILGNGVVPQQAFYALELLTK